MKKRRTISNIVLKLLLLLPVTAVAEVESWYTMWGLGMARHQYPTPLQNITNEWEDAPGVDRSQYTWDVLGFYFPLADDRRAVGFVINGTADAFSDTADQTALRMYSYGVSMLNFFGTEIGQGFYLRSDVGASRLILSNTGVSGNFQAASDWGVSTILGLGYGLPISSQTRILFGANYTGKYIQDDYFGAFEFVIAGLW